MNGARAILDLVDAAEPFVDQPEALELDPVEVRRRGLDALNALLTTFGAAEGDARMPALAAAAEGVGGLIAIDAVHDGFARAALERVAAQIGLVHDHKAKGVRAAIAAGIKAGKAKPSNLGVVGVVPAKKKRRPRPAAGRSLSSLSSSPPASSPVAAPAPPVEGIESTSSQTGATTAADGGGGAGGDATPVVGDGDRSPDDDDQLNLRLAFFPLTDLGNAERFRERYRGRLLFCAAIGWLAWDGRRYSVEGAEELVKIAEHDTVRAIQAEADAVRKTGNRDEGVEGGRDFTVETKRDGTVVLYSDKIARWGRASEAANKLGALSKRGAPYFSISIDKLDADPMKINVANGTLVVQRSRDGDYVAFKPHDPADLITKMSPVNYDKSAACPIYDAMLAKIQPSEIMRRFLHQWAGLSLTGDTSEQKLAFLYGKGRNGKSTLVDVWSIVAGDYGETVPVETFLDHGKARGAGQATPDLAILPGKRLLRTSEPEKGSRLAESLIKLVTGGEPIQARHLNRDFFKFYPQFKLTMSGNYRPQISGTDEGIWRRMRLVPFNVKIEDAEADIHLSEKLRKEASGILNRMLDGLRDWCDNGLIEPDEVVYATAQYRSDSDPLGRFLQTCVEASPGSRVQSSVMHELFDAWCKASGEKTWSARGFGLAMKERGYAAKQSNVMWWLDVKLTKSPLDFIDADGRPRHLRDGEDREDDDDAADIPI